MGTETDNIVDDLCEQVEGLQGDRNELGAILKDVLRLMLRKADTSDAGQAERQEIRDLIERVNDVLHPMD